MKIIYRPHRSTLKQSIEEQREFSSIEFMFAYIAHQYNFAFSMHDIYISFYYCDERTKEHTFLISVRKYGKLNFLKKYKSPQAIGYCIFEKGEEK